MAEATTTEKPMRVHWKLFLAEKKKKKHCSSSRTHREKPHCDPPSLVWWDIFLNQRRRRLKHFIFSPFPPVVLKLNQVLVTSMQRVPSPFPLPVPAFILLTRKQSIDLFWLLLKICSKKNYFFLVGRGQKQRRWLNHFRPTKEQIWHCFTAEGWRVFLAIEFTTISPKKYSFFFVDWACFPPCLAFCDTPSFTRKTLVLFSSSQKKA